MKEVFGFSLWDFCSSTCPGRPLSLLLFSGVKSWVSVWAQREHLQPVLVQGVTHIWRKSSASHSWVSGLYGSLRVSHMHAHMWFGKWFSQLTHELISFLLIKEMSQTPGTFSLDSTARRRGKNSDSSLGYWTGRKKRLGGNIILF